MKTTDEIKRNIVTCMELNMENFMPGATQKALADALACIRQLEAERNAAVNDLKNVCELCSVCCACKDRFEGGESCRGCIKSSHWQWRGVRRTEHEIT